ncbi:uncharacterized protein [Musca autumnalis]|uniref:uncharacterized protein n=1 Tax=Musca autumnalis TaxID=221902 RepID=UPI003CF000CC
MDIMNHQKNIILLQLQLIVQVPKSSGGRWQYKIILIKTKKKTYVDKATSPIKIIQVPNTTTTTASPTFVPFSPAFIVPYSTSPASSVTTTTVGSDSRISQFWPFYNTVGTASCASAISSSLFAPITTTTTVDTSTTTVDTSNTTVGTSNTTVDTSTTTVDTSNTTVDTSTTTVDTSTTTVDTSNTTVGTSNTTTASCAISSSLFAPITNTVDTSTVATTSATALLLSSPPPFIPPPPTQSSGTNDNDDDFIAIVDQVFSQPLQPVVELKRKRKNVVVNTRKENMKKKRKQYSPQLMEYAVDLCLQNRLTAAQANTYYSLPARTVSSKLKAAREEGIINKAPSSSVSGYMPDDQ